MSREDDYKADQMEEFSLTLEDQRKLTTQVPSPPPSAASLGLDRALGEAEETSLPALSEGELADLRSNGNAAAV